MHEFPPKLSGICSIIVKQNMQLNLYKNEKKHVQYQQLPSKNINIVMLSHNWINISKWYTHYKIIEQNYIKKKVKENMQTVSKYTKKIIIIFKSSHSKHAKIYIKLSHWARLHGSTDMPTSIFDQPSPTLVLGTPGVVLPCNPIGRLWSAPTIIVSWPGLPGAPAILAAWVVAANAAATGLFWFNDEPGWWGNRCWPSSE